MAEEVKEEEEEELKKGEQKGNEKMWEETDVISNRSRH